MISIFNILCRTRALRLPFQPREPVRGGGTAIPLPRPEVTIPLPLRNQEQIVCKIPSNVIPTSAMTLPNSDEFDWLMEDSKHFQQSFVFETMHYFS